MKSKRILYILHSYYNRAGTEEHTRDLALGLKDRFEVYIASPDKGRVVLIHDTKEVGQYRAPEVSWPVTPYRSPTHEDALKDIIEKVSPDLIHIQHIMNWPLGVIDQLHATGIPLVVSFHDYYLLTPEFTMQRAVSHEVSLTPHYSVSVFGEDITPYLLERRSLLLDSIRNTNVRVAPSHYVASIFEKAFGLDTKVIPHGIEPFVPQPTQASSELRFGYVGSLLPQKGYQELIAAYKKAKADGLRASLTLFGDSPQAKKEPFEGIEFAGSYSRKDLPSIMSRFDVGIIPSIFPETFCYVLSEMWHAKKPVIASQIGAIPERFGDNTGVLFAPGDMNRLAELLVTLELNGSWRQWKIPEVTTLSSMLSDYEKVYNSQIKGGV